jgi:hypothetical protein
MFQLKRPSPALLISIIALVLAATGVAGALPGKKSVDKNDLKKSVVKTKTIQNSAVTTAKLANGSVTQAKLDSDSRGQAVAFAEVNADGTVGPNTRGINNADITRQGSGTTTIYCLHGMPQHGTLTVTPGFGATEFDGIVSANLDQVPIDPNSGACSGVPGLQAAVFTYYDDFFGSIAPRRAPMPFFVTLFR